MPLNALHHFLHLLQYVIKMVKEVNISEFNQDACKIGSSFFDLKPISTLTDGGL